MGRANYEFRDTQLGRKRINPIWHGIGFVILVALAVGGFWLAGYLLELNWQDPFLPFPIPRNFSLTVIEGMRPIPGKLVVQVVTALVMDIVGFSVLVFIYGLFNPMRLGPTDAPQPRGGRRRRSMVR